MNATTPATLPYTGDPEADALLAELGLAEAAGSPVRWSSSSRPPASSVASTSGEASASSSLRNSRSSTFELTLS